MINAFLDEPLHDPAAEALGEVRAKLVSPEDRKRFMKTVWLAMDVMNRSPKTEVSVDEQGKPLAKKLVEDVELPLGAATIEVVTEPEAVGSRKGQPVTHITLVPQYEMFNADSGKLWANPVERVYFYSDGSMINVFAENRAELDDSKMWSSFHVDHLDPKNPDYNYDLRITNGERTITKEDEGDWGFFQDLEDAVQALDDQTPLN